MYSLSTKPNIDKIFSKLSKKNPEQMNMTAKKIEQILETPRHFKPLREDMHGAIRVHIGKSFVLTYGIDEENKIMTLLEIGRAHV